MWRAKAGQLTSGGFHGVYGGASDASSNRATGNPQRLPVTRRNYFKSLSIVGFERQAM